MSSSRVMTGRIEPKIELWSHKVANVSSDIGMLAELLHACVHAGASIGFCLPFSVHDAEDFWRDQVLPAVQAGHRKVLVAWRARQIVGTVQIDLATPPNQPHRAEIKKLLVHPQSRREGLGRFLVTAIESERGPLSVPCSHLTRKPEAPPKGSIALWDIFQSG
jgi:hypothetical protein